MKPGMFMMPIHRPGRDIRATLREDREAVLLADRLGYSEAHGGEHATDAAASARPIPTCPTKPSRPGT